MKHVRWLLAVGAVLTLQSPAPAETYKGIGPYYTFNDVKAMFPNADVELVPAAWVQPHQVVVNVTGVGMDGTTIIIFKDLRTIPEATDIDRLMATLMDVDESTPLKKAIVTDGVRWAPARPVPAAHIIELYGKDYKRTINRDTLGIVLSWEKKGVFAHLNDDGKTISFVEYMFTKQELGYRYLRLRNAAREREKDAQATARQPVSVRTKSLTAHRAWKLYQANCAACHGNRGEGGETVAIDSAWEQGEKYIREFIEMGDDRGMPSFEGKLSTKETLELVDFVMKLRPTEEPADDVL